LTYNYQIPDLLNILYQVAPTKVDAISLHRRTVEYGLVTVGLKLHYLKDDGAFDPLIEALGGSKKILEVNAYRRTAASLCLVLPPVGSARAAIMILEALESYVGMPMFENRDLQIQVCSPGRLVPRSCALLAIGFYLGSPNIRRYQMLDELETTFTKAHHNPHARRIVLYDANGTFERDFVWWKGIPPSKIVYRRKLPFGQGRSDVLVSHPTRLDIENINLLATLLIHAQQVGYWSTLGRQFIAEFEHMLDEHMLLGLLEAPWVRSTPETQDDTNFFAALQELSAYAFEQAGARIEPAERKKLLGLFSLMHEKVRKTPALHQNGLLVQMQSLLNKYRSEMKRLTPIHYKRG
jgi:hypothetical protein